MIVSILLLGRTYILRPGPGRDPDAGRASQEWDARPGPRDERPTPGTGVPVLGRGPGEPPGALGRDPELWSALSYVSALTVRAVEA